MANRGRSNTLRIIGGEHRGRKLRFPDVKGLRPTADRVRETLFNWLQADIAGAWCLDLFAGSGALGFEAVSRGAGGVLMCESSLEVVKQLQENAIAMRIESKVDIRQQSALKLLAEKPQRSFDLVFCDPPFADGLLAKSCELLQSGGWLSANAFIYLEQDSAHQWPELPGSWKLHREGQAGQAKFRLMNKGDRSILRNG